MPNAKDSTQHKPPRILVLAQSGAGKTSQFLTLPGKKFAYLFDPNALLSLQGYDVDYEEFLPDDLSLKLTSLKKENQPRNPGKKKGAELYNAWEKDFDDKRESGFFDQYDAIMIDSCTTLLDMIMDGVLAVNGRGGQWPQQDDYGPQMLAFQNIMRTFTSLGKTIYVTGHMEMKQDQFTKRIFMTPLFTGRLKTKIPLLFSETLGFEVESDGKGNVAYICQTKSDKLVPLVRTTMKGAKFKENIDIDFGKDIEYQGLGGLLKREGVIK